MNRRISPEITDQIIDYLYDDKSALKQGSLVCKEWRPSTCLHLFTSLKVSPNKDAEALNLLSTAGSTITRCARSLTIALEEDLGLHHIWANKNIPKLPVFPSVDKLCLKCLDWEQMGTDAKAYLLRITHRAVVLTLVDVTFGSIQEGQDYLLAAPLLTNLWMDGACVFFHQDSTIIRPNLNISQMRVDLSMFKYRPFLRWLLQSPFSILELVNIPHYFATMIAACDHLGPTLLHLKLTFKTRLSRDLNRLEYY